jgi:hypothetical protein
LGNFKIIYIKKTQGESMAKLVKGSVAVKEGCSLNLREEFKVVTHSTLETSVCRTRQQLTWY